MKDHPWQFEPWGRGAGSLAAALSHTTSMWDLREEDSDARSSDRWFCTGVAR